MASNMLVRYGRYWRRGIRQEMYFVGQVMSGIRPGDFVRPVRACKSFECGWAGGFEERMKVYVGRIGKARSVGEFGITVEFAGGEQSTWPYFCLRKAHPVSAG